MAERLYGIISSLNYTTKHARAHTRTHTHAHAYTHITWQIGQVDLPIGRMIGDGIEIIVAAISELRQFSGDFILAFIRGQEIADVDHVTDDVHEGEENDAHAGNAMQQR